MTEEELEAWFAKNGGRGSIIRCYSGNWEVTVYDVEDTQIEGFGEGDSLLEALSDAVADYQRYVCGAI